MDIYSESGRIRALEKKFLTSKQVQSIIEAKNIGEVISILEKSFYKFPSPILNTEEIIELLDKERNFIYEEIEKISPDILRIFLLKNDFFNLRIILENKSNYVLPCNLPGQILKGYIEGNKGNIPDFLKKGVKIVKSEKNIEEKLLDLKNEYYIQLYNLLTAFNSSFIEKYGKIEIDFANLSTFILKKKKGEKIVSSFFIRNGNTRAEKFLNEEAILKSLTKEYKITDIPINEESFEIIRYKAIMNYIKEGRIIPYGIEVIFSYFIAREIEVEIIQKLLISKFYNIDENILKKQPVIVYQWK